MHPKLSIIVVSYRDAERLTRCLGSIARFGALGSTTGEVIVVKNSDETLDATSMPAEYLTVIQNETNEGFGVAVNRAAKFARGSHLLLLNPDAELREDSIPQLLKFLSEHQEASIVGLRQQSSDGQTVASFGNQPNVLREVAALTGLSRVLPVGRLVRPTHVLGSLYRQSGKRGWVGGGAACINADVFRAFGGFNEDFFLYVEDVELCRRVSRAGGEVWYCAESIVTHNDGASRAAVRDRSVAQRRTTEGLIRYAELYGQPVGALRAVQSIKQLVRA